MNQKYAFITTAATLVTFAMMFTATIPFQQQEAYANHVCWDATHVAVHIGGADAECLTSDQFDEACAAGAPYDECDPQPLIERYSNQGTCVDAGESKDDCKAAFKADKKK
jgi:hypothetical protein